MKLSLLVCSLAGRSHQLERLKEVLELQLTDGVELIIDVDNGEKSIGAKRNDLLDQAVGDYIAFIDDDDLVSSDYVEKILECLELDPDVVGIHLLHFNDGQLGGFTYHSLEYKSWFHQPDRTTGFMRYYRNPNHLNPVKRELALQTKFPDKSFGEDSDYSKRLLPLLKSQEYIKEPVYIYLYQTKKVM